MSVLCSLSSLSARVPKNVSSTRRILLEQNRNLHVNVLLVGKKNGLEPWIQEGVEEYERRLRPVMAVATHVYKNNPELEAAASKLKGPVFALDERGKELNSMEFEKTLYKSLEEGGATVNFIIGGFDGLPPALRTKYKDSLLSLSRMTWTHQMARLLLLEQIYRASEIKKGSAYHKD